MACRCSEEGRQKTIHFQRCGRWETRVYCEHTYQRAGLRSHNPRFGQREHLAHVVKDERRIRRRPTKGCNKIKYTDEMDAFIQARYGSKGRWVRTEKYGKGEMKLLAKAFAEKFGLVNVTPNKVIGRWNRLKKLEVAKPVVPGERGIPSLPALKFLS